MLYYIIFLLVGILVGAALIYLYMHTQVKALNDQCRLLDTARQELHQQMERERQDLHSQLDHERQYAQRLIEANRAEMAEQLAAKQASLQDSNRQQMDELLKPLKEQFISFQRSVNETRTQNETNKNDLVKSFENTMNLFRQEQQLTVRALSEQTARIGTDAANLTRALKGDSKTQGDWGEMVLETMLEHSGLKKGEHFFVQENVKDEQGNLFRPDVVVRFPEGRAVIIDSKVSLTAYADAIAAEDEAARNRCLKEHVQSMKTHVNELAQKDYSSLVSDAIGYVLMFVPNEASYIAAMKHDSGLSKYAYDRHIIIISPSNLLMALQLAYNLWQTDRQNKNVEKIVKTANDLYDKVAGFSESFEEIEGRINALSRSFATARNRLYDGPGNVLRRIENLKQLGVTPKKEIRGLEES